MRPFRICLVCTGNTCRSPMAEGILKRIGAEHRTEAWEITSAGLHALPGARATPEAIAAAAEHDIDISGHRARRFSRDAARRCDLLLVHSGEHLVQLRKWGPEIGAKSFLLKSFPDAGDPGPDAWVRDPVGLPLEDYRRTYLELDEVLRRIFPQLAAWAAKVR